MKKTLIALIAFACAICTNAKPPKWLKNARKALGICDYAYVLENGKISLEGTGEELLNSDEVRKAYLGG